MHLAKKQKKLLIGLEESRILEKPLVGQTLPWQTRFGWERSWVWKNTPLCLKNNIVRFTKQLRYVYKETLGVLGENSGSFTLKLWEFFLRT